MLDWPAENPPTGLVAACLCAAAVAQAHRRMGNSLSFPGDAQTQPAFGGPPPSGVRFLRPAGPSIWPGIVDDGRGASGAPIGGPPHAPRTPDYSASPRPT